MKTPMHFATALSRQTARTSPKLGHGFHHFPPVPAIIVIPASPVLTPATFAAPASPPSSSASRREAISFLARRTEQRDASLAPPKPFISLAPIPETVAASASGADASPQTSTEADVTDDAAWPSLHFASCECETCDPPTSRIYSSATPRAASDSVTPPLASATKAEKSAAPIFVRPPPRRRAVDDATALRKKALRLAMEHRHRGRSPTASTFPSILELGPGVPTVVLNGVEVLFEDGEATKARVEGEWFVRWRATEYLRRAARHGF